MSEVVSNACKRTATYIDTVMTVNHNLNVCSTSKFPYKKAEFFLMQPNY